MKKIITAILFTIIVLTLTSCMIRPLDETSDNETKPTIAETDDITETETETETEVETEVLTEPVEDVVTKASFIGCGDNIIYYGTYRDAKSQAFAGGRTYNFRPMYSEVESIISSADLAFINQETVISHSNEPQSYPNFNSPVDIADDLVDVGFDIISVANNHMLDHGALGLKETYDNWKKRNVTLVGCHEENESGKYVTYIEKNGIRIGIVSYTYGTNLGEDPAKYGLYASYLKYADVAGEVAEARENADFVIVSVHWGKEGAMTPDEEQKKYAHIMADNGADVIIGHHPHVLQPIEWIDGANGNKTLCVYSLGNFLHEQDWEYNVPGGMISFDIQKINNERATVENVLFIPTVCHYPRSFYGNKVYLLENYTAELANSHAVKTYYKHDISLNGLISIVKKTISTEFLPESFR
ncbi:MAG: CapA family protein [Clostridia bacterium]|nr:CapA family protein [Clostridia bacterium]